VNPTDSAAPQAAAATGVPRPVKSEPFSAKAEPTPTQKSPIAGHDFHEIGYRLWSICRCLKEAVIKSRERALWLRPGFALNFASEVSLRRNELRTLCQVHMDARRRSAAKVGTLASCATKQTLQLTQPDQIATLLRDRSAFVQMKTRSVAKLFG